MKVEIQHTCSCQYDVNLKIWSVADLLVCTVPFSTSHSCVCRLHCIIHFGLFVRVLYIQLSYSLWPGQEHTNSAKHCEMWSVGNCEQWDIAIRSTVSDMYSEWPCLPTECNWWECLRKTTTVLQARGTVTQDQGQYNRQSWLKKGKSKQWRYMSCRAADMCGGKENRTQRVFM